MVRVSYLNSRAYAFFCYNLRRGGGLGHDCAPRGATSLSIWVTVPLVLSRVCALLGPYYACGHNDTIPSGYAAISLGDYAFALAVRLRFHAVVPVPSTKPPRHATPPSILGDCAFGFELRLLLDLGHMMQSCFCAKDGAILF